MIRCHALEGAPLGVAEALSNAANDVLLVRLVIRLTRDGNTNRNGHGGLRASLARDTVCTRSSAVAPGAIVGVAEIAGALRGTLWVKAGFLVERDCVGRVGVAEDVSTTAAVMATGKEGERLRARV